MNDWIPVAVEADAVDRVRGRVTGRIRRRRNLRRGAAVLAAVLAVAVALWPAPVELETISYIPPGAPPAPQWVAVPPKPVTKSNVLLAKVQSRPADRITIFTDDPNVVIVLVGDGGE
ncbi:MAG: hypothetical protein HYX27_23425 [Acidobacteria bacterium]|nr:hypothetical protein [Acidobacteriota bacterium]